MRSDSSISTAPNMLLPEPLSGPCADELATDQSKQTSNTKTYACLPEELLERIVAALDPLPDARKVPDWLSEFYARRTWLACSSVSRQFHRIVLPYLFHSVKVNNDQCTRLHSYARFYTDTPWVATHVRHVTIQSPMKLLDIKEFDWLLRSLPSLLHLTALGVQFFVRTPGTYHEEPPHPSPIRGHTLRRLTFRDIEETGYQYKHFAEALALFSDVEELEVAGRTDLASFDYGEMMRAIPAAISAARDGSVKVRKLVLRRADTITAFVVSVLSPSGAFNHLSSLTYTVNSSDLLSNLSEVLHNVSQTLECLTIYVTFQGDLATSDSDGAFSATCYGLSRCDKLNECCIEAIVPVSFDRFAPLIGYGEFSVDARRAWEALSELVAHVSPGHIHRLSLVLFVGDLACHVNFSHNLPWEPMKKALRRFVNVQTLKMWLYTANDTAEDCVAYEMQEFVELLDYKIPTHRLPAILGQQCNNDGCEQYRKRKTVTDEHV